MSIAGIKVTDYAVAKMVGVRPHVISRFMQGERGVNLPTVDKICGALKLKLVRGNKGVTR